MCLSLLIVVLFTQQLNLSAEEMQESKISRKNKIKMLTKKRKTKPLFCSEQKNRTHLRLFWTNRQNQKERAASF